MSLRTRSILLLAALVPLPLALALLIGHGQAGPGDRKEEGPADPVVLVVHGGASSLPKKKLPPGQEKVIRDALTLALKKGHAALQKEGGTSLDGVEAAVRVLEDSPLFNAGKGAVFTHDGRNELDASIMEGKDKKAGAVTCVTIIKNPISAARAVMEKSKHVLLSGRGAELFATMQGLEIVDPSYFWTRERWEKLKQALEEEKKEAKPKKGSRRPDAPEKYFGTVGAVALDAHGNLAAGTSTGGMTNKMTGRIGDSPIIGAGTYADNDACAVSGTGHGEYFIRYAVAHEITALMKYRGLSVEQASAEVIKKLKAVGGRGGVIALDRQGRFAMPYNTGRMFRGCITRSGKVRVAVFEEQLPE